jgi:hypothetical protein
MHVVRRAGPLVVAMILCGLFAPASTAVAASDYDAYISHVADTMQAKDHHVFRDGSATQLLSNDEASSLDSKIKDSGKPIYLAVLNDSAAHQADSPKQLLTDLHNAIGLKRAIMAVGTTSGFYVDGYNVPPNVVAAAKDSATRYVRQGARGDELFTGWVDDTVNIKASDGTSSDKRAWGDSGGHGWLLWVALIVFVLVLLLVFVLWGRRRSEQRHEEEDEQQYHDRLQRRLELIDQELMELELSAKLDAAVKTSCDLSRSSLDGASKALDAGDLDDAEMFIDRAQEHLDRANDLDSGTSTQQDSARATGSDSSNSEEEEGPDMWWRGSRTSSSRRSRSSSNGRSQANAAKFRDPNSGQTVIVNNTPQPYSPVYSNQWGGGLVGGTYFAPGYYSSPLDMLLKLEMLEMVTGGFDSNGNFQEGFEAGQQADGNDSGYTGDEGQPQDDVGGGEFSDTDTEPGGGDYSNDSSDSFGGGSSGGDTTWGSGPDPAPAPEPVSYDYGGGGYADSSSSWGSDSGGGSDFGGGDSGGGDW